MYMSIRNSIFLNTEVYRFSLPKLNTDLMQPPFCYTFYRSSNFKFQKLHHHHFRILPKRGLMVLQRHKFRG